MITTDFFFASLSLKIILIYHILDSINLLFNYKLFLNNNILSYFNTIKDNIYNLKSLKYNIILRWLFSNNSILLLISIRLILSTLFLFDLISFSFLYLILIIQVIILIRNELCLNLADSFSFLVLFGLSNYFYSDSQFNKEISLYFIAIMTLISYLFTSFYKFKGEKWRKGNALKLIMGSAAYGNERVHDFLDKNKKTSIFLNHSIILFQAGSILSIFSPKISIIFIFIGIIFHLSIAALMNLNNFFWVYLSTYPCIYYLSLKINLF